MDCAEELRLAKASRDDVLRKEAELNAERLAFQEKQDQVSNCQT